MNETKLLENLILLTSIIVGGVGIGFLNVVYSLLYFIFVIVMHLLVSRKLICTNCSHYDSSCHLGWNKISSRLFEKGEEEKFKSNMKWVGAPVWTLTFLLPAVAMLIPLVDSFSLTLSIILIFYLILAGTGLITLEKFGCSGCDMKDRCLIGRI